MSEFPRDLASYGDADVGNLLAVLANRISVEPFNLIVTLIFLAAIVHTFATPRFLALSQKWEGAHEIRRRSGEIDRTAQHMGARLFHFLGEIEAVFGIWAVVLGAAIIAFHDWDTLIGYMSEREYSEPMFVVVIMTLASSRPILKGIELMMGQVARVFGGGLTAWWLTILTLGPLLGSLITEPAAMAISALLLGQKFYSLQPSRGLKYATLGLLFVNVSVGGTLTNFAAPPVVLVAEAWGWDLSFMLTTFGWKAAVGIVLANLLYALLFRRELAQLQELYHMARVKLQLQERFVRLRDMQSEFLRMEREVGADLGFAATFEARCQVVKGELRKGIVDAGAHAGASPELLEEAFEQRFEEMRRHELRRTLPGLLPEAERVDFRDPDWDSRPDRVPFWMMLVHVGFLVWTVVNAHHPPLFVAGLLFFLGFARVTYPFQNRINLQQPLMVGFFLAGLVIHGGLQGWWLAPLLGRLQEGALMVSATALTAFNDNAAITFLSTLVPNFSESLRYAVVAGAVAGGGLTVMANAPNPAGQSILRPYFRTNVSPLRLLAAAAAPTAVMWLLFFVLRG
jgi:hypothetical protein